MDNYRRSHILDDNPTSPTSVRRVPKFISLTNQNFRRQRHDHSHADCCQPLICFFCTVFFLLVVLLLFFFASMYTILTPKLPKYKVSSIAINSLHVNPVSTNVSTDFTLYVEADNPNKRVGILYRDAGKVSALFRGEILCTGEIPQFLQPENNITLIKIGMTGQSEAGPGVRAALLEGIAGPPSGETLELHIVAKVPVAIRLDNMTTIWRFRIDTMFTLKLNNITPGRQSRIESSKHRFEVDYMDWM